MDTGLTLSVVVPSFNRGEKVRPAIEALLRSDVAGIAPLEIVVVDDGSRTPLEHIISSYTPPPGVCLRCLRQSNGGPAAARNRGFRETSGDIVLFVDDDVLLPPHLIKKHIELHCQHPRSVIFGPTAPPQPVLMTPEYEGYLSLWPTLPDGVQAVPDEAVNSSHLSVEREMFAAENGVYGDHLRIPVAEEVELLYRLKQRGVPILCATDAVAIHLQPLGLESVCRQQYTHALGMAEVLRKCPQVRYLRTLRPLTMHVHRVTGTTTRQLASSYAIRQCVVYCYLAAKMCRLPRRLLRELYRIAVSCWYIAGLRAGLRPEYRALTHEFGRTVM